MEQVATYPYKTRTLGEPPNLPNFDFLKSHLWGDIVGSLPEALFETLVYSPKLINRLPIFVGDKLKTLYISFGRFYFF